MVFQMRRSPQDADASSEAAERVFGVLGVWVSGFRGLGFRGSGFGFRGSGV